MITVFFGGASSGKSDLAEAFALSLDNFPIKYLATLREENNQENEDRIREHQRKREGLPYETLLTPTPEEGMRFLAQCQDKTVLLDCLGVMVANTKFTYQHEKSTFVERPNASVCEEIIHYLDELNNTSRHLIVVTPDIFSGNCEEAESSQNYMHLLGDINRKLVKKFNADFVEVKAGLPLAHRCEGKELSNFLKGFQE
ncbi:MAG: bifunctional adenosylcobinamide kinase/adenosylcobinamide-phosphate guanylyltransferase [Eubacteriales bacterium]|nr:bifunctional adenosylcobinamide kinase/adenosylcobinamide-phosphate guanylyltransferase [Eubacteriales bacterium]